MMSQAEDTFVPAVAAPFVFLCLLPEFHVNFMAISINTSGDFPLHERLLSI